MRSLACLPAFALLLTLALNQSWSAYTDIRTGLVTLMNGATQTNTSLPASYNISYDNSISQTTSCGIGIVGFNTYQTNDFSVNVTITNFTVSNMFLTGIVLDSTQVTYLAINYIAVGALTYFLEVQFSCFLPTVISKGNGTRSDTLTGTTFFVNQAELACNVYLSGFRMTNSQGLINYLNAQVSCPSSTLTYTFTASENNTVSQICYTTFIFCDACTNITYYEWGQAGQNWLSQTILPSTINEESTQYYSSGNNGNDRTFYGMSAFNVSRGLGRNFNFQTDYYLNGANTMNHNYSTNSGTYAILISYFFIATRGCNNISFPWFQIFNNTLSCVTNCISGTYQTLGGSAQYCAICDYSCQQCTMGALSTDCTGCDSTQYRVLDTTAHTCSCQSGYIDIGVSLCQVCSYYIPGCSICLSTTVCTNCLPGFALNLAGTCQCTTGFLATTVCTTVYGCIAATNLAGTIYCTACNSSAYYEWVSNYSCICETGYYMDSNGNCKGRCGDGLLAVGQECDDDNTVSGDGCSSTCQIQLDYQCLNNPMPSVCKLDMNVTGTVVWVRRILDANTVEFALSISPSETLYNNMNFYTGSNMDTNMPCSASGTTAVMQNSYLVIDCPYTQSIEGNNYNISLQMDPKFFVSNAYLTAQVHTTGMNAKLTYDSNYSLNTMQNILILVAVAFALAIFFLSSITERMIGVELIQSYQLVLYNMTMMMTCPSSLAPLQNLQYSNGYNNLWANQYVRIYQFLFPIGQVGLSPEFLVNYNIMYAIYSGVLIVTVTLKVILLNFQSDLTREEKEYNRKFVMEDFHPYYKTIKQAYKFFFERIWFLMSFLSMFLIIFSIANEITLADSGIVTNTEMNNFLCMFAGLLVIVFLTMVILNGKYPKLSIFPMFMDKRYPIYYSIYNITYIVILTSFYKQNAAPYMMVSMNLINILVLLYWKPYPQSIHNITIVVEQAMITVAIFFYIYESYTPNLVSNQGIFMIGFFAITALLYVVNGLSGYRLYKYWKYMKAHNLSYDDPQDIDKQEQKALMTAPVKDFDNQFDNIDDQFSRKNSVAKNANNKKSGAPSSIKPYEDNYYQNIKSSKQKNPLSNSNQFQDNQETRRNISKPQKINEDFETFNNNKTPKNIFQIDKIDPNAKQIKKQPDNNSPYDEFGNIKPHNPINGVEEYDALKAIKARLRKDFYQKVQGQEPSKPQPSFENSQKVSPDNFEPSDLNDQE